MRAFVQTAVGRFEERDVPTPRAGPGEVVLRVRAALTCGTDLKLLKRGHAAISLPVTMGHELSGEIVEVGGGVDAARVGERVVPGVSGPCGKCADCRGGLLNLCSSGHSDRTWGAFAEFVRVPAGVVASNLHAVPLGVPDPVAAFLDPLASVLHGWKRLGPAPQRLLIYGAGAVGLLWAAVARARNTRAVVAGRRAQRLRAAVACGAEVWDLGSQSDLQGEAPDAAVDCTGDPSVWGKLPSLVRPGGRVLLFGGCAPGAAVTFDAARLHYSEISLVGSFHYTPEEAGAAMALLANGEIDPRPLVTEEGDLEDLPRFLEAQGRGEGIRYAVVMN